MSVWVHERKMHKYSEQYLPVSENRFLVGEMTDCYFLFPYLYPLSFLLAHKLCVMKKKRREQRETRTKIFTLVQNVRIWKQAWTKDHRDRFLKVSGCLMICRHAHELHISLKPCHCGLFIVKNIFGLSVETFLVPLTLGLRVSSGSPQPEMSLIVK